MSDHMPEKQPNEKISSLVQNMIGRRVISTGMVFKSDPDAVHTVFMPLGLGALKEFSEDDLKQVVVFAIDGEDKTTGQALNGWPIFVEMRVWLKSDFDEAISRARIVEGIIHNNFDAAPE